MEFRWPVLSSAYEWINATIRRDGEDVSVRLLTEYPGRDAARTMVEPFGTDGLFRIFAELDPIEDAIEAFADEFGLLGHPVMMGAKAGGNEIVGEPIDRWASQVKRMQAAVRLWDFVQADDFAGIEQAISAGVPSVPWGRSIGTAWHSLMDETAIGADYAAQRMHGWQVAQALKYIRNQINAGLANCVEPKLGWDPDGGRLRLNVAPASLIGAIWLQFAFAVDSDARFRRCDTCGTWFSIAPPKRESRKYCSDACRTRAYRERHTTKESTDE